jgi:site-specific DNA recombinase
MTKRRKPNRSSNSKRQSAMGAAKRIAKATKTTRVPASVMPSVRPSKKASILAQLQRAAELSANWPALTAVRRRRIIAALVDRIVVAVDRVDIHLLPSHLAAVLRDAVPQPISAGSAEENEQPIPLSVPAQFRRAGLGIRMLVEEGGLPGWAAKADPKLVKLIARAHLFHQKLVEGTSKYLDQVARGLGFTSSYLTRLLRLTYLAPDITRAILDGRHPREFTAQKLLSHSRLPLGWPEQRRILGFT